MKEQKAGHIINVSSVAGHTVRPGGAVYSATKTAVRVISEGLRQEVKPYNIRTTVISPGAVATELPNSITEPDVAEGVQTVLQGDCNSCRLVCAGSRLRDEPAGRGGHKRDPFPAHTPGALSAVGCFS
jgi:NAD(P)-dependent dehydrogenase (short-subunit alcohol dehydrogenase family)